MAEPTHHRALIIGGGTAGITVVASLQRRGSGAIDIAVVEPSATVYDLAHTRRSTDSEDDGL
jgi:sulfide:quinone oxidoreductase